MGHEQTDEADTPVRATDRLLLDVMLGKLARYLRMCGYDAAYALDRDEEADDRLLAMARSEGRTLVTRDRGLANRTSDSVLLTARDVDDQLRELSDAGYRLALADRPARCGQCNGIVERVDDSEATPGYAPDTSETAVWRCVDCGQYFWKGSHWDDVGETLRTL
ncbi:Mut7-C RNAse domain-containing protein [Halorientalis brevis]|uniref:Mut7-C RNAse domain-containing protein n=1 Tax=Halorientalis brevis TaxID=1126241 RepID=A0ABD6C9U2_9EURY|nr:Mut7-C RNAse domain-containing protein [Halorientalis brevis]